MSKKLETQYNKLAKMHADYFMECDKTKQMIIEKFIITEEELEKNDETDLRSCSGVFYQQSDGLVFELMSYNAPLKKIVCHILKYGQITLQEYIDYYTI